MTSKQWGGRFEEPVDALVEQLGESVSYDRRLALYDIAGSQAHARMLGERGIISKEDAAAIIDGLDAVRAAIEAGRIEWDPALEDVHTNIEAALVERIGDAGKRLHTARSRNDQIALDTRMWARDQIDRVREGIRALQTALVDLADAHRDVVVPGCTHLQHAQPVLFAHHLLAYFEMFQRDRDRFAELRRRVNIMPLGSAALAGTPHAIDRRMVAEELGFAGISANSMDAVSDRDYLIEFCANASLVMMHLSRLSEELVLWSAPAYGYITIGDAFTTGSSIMPQKKNPDVAELVRGKAGRVYGGLTALLTLMKGLPMTYNRDLQEDKEPAFDASDTVQLCLAVTAKMLPSIEVHAGRMREACREGFLEATDLADFLVERGVPFREAHGIVGRLVLRCSRDGKRLGDLRVTELQEESAVFDESVRALLEPEALVARRATPGGTAPKRVASALRKARKVLDKP
jgi:argininosuccinate lyase